VTGDGLGYVLSVKTVVLFPFARLIFFRRVMDGVSRGVITGFVWLYTLFVFFL
jgi:hypothetical protein